MIPSKQMQGTQALKHPSIYLDPEAPDLAPSPVFPFARAQPQLSPTLDFLDPCGAGPRDRETEGEYPLGDLGGSGLGSPTLPSRSGRGATDSQMLLLPWQAPQPTPLQDPAILCSICAVKDLEPRPVHRPPRMLLIDYPTAGTLLSADGTMKPSTWEPEASGSARGEGQVGKEGWRGEGEGEEVDEEKAALNLSLIHI